MGKENLIGTWHLVSSEFRHADGEVTYPLGKNAVGLLIYTTEGYMAVQLMRSDRPAFVSDDVFQGTPEEIKAAYEGFAAYFGTYTVDEVAGTITHHVQGHIFPNRIGSKATRAFTLVDQCLTLRGCLKSPEMSVFDRCRAISESATIALSPLKSIMPIFTWIPCQAAMETFQTAS